MYLLYLQNDFHFLFGLCYQKLAHEIWYLLPLVHNCSKICMDDIDPREVKFKYKKVANTS